MTEQYTYPTFVSVSALRKAVVESGSHFFDHDALRFFRSRIGSNIYGGRLIVTSEQAGDDRPRLYTLRMVRQYLDHSMLHMTTVGGFQRFSSYAAAHSAARKLGDQLRSGAIRPCDIDDDVIDGYLAVSDYREND